MESTVSVTSADNTSSLCAFDSNLQRRYQALTPAQQNKFNSLCSSYRGTVPIRLARTYMSAVEYTPHDRPSAQTRLPVGVMCGMTSASASATGLMPS